MKFWTRLLTALLCVSLLFSAVPAVMAETDTYEYGPALESPLNEEEKLELMAALYEADIVSVREAIMDGLISCQELTAYYLKRIEDYADPYNCFITICDNAMDIAKERDAALVAGTAKGKLFGVPIVVKDNMNYKGYPTTNGVKSRLSTKATSNATVVDRLLKEGVVVLGKTNMSVYANYASHSTSSAGGTTKNAYSTYLSPGGSSGGSAVAVSLNLAVAGLGTDTGSSLRLPAVLNGCYSMRVTHGSISRSGITTLAASKDVPGAITRSPADLALMLDVMSADTNYYENLDANALEGAKFAVIKQLSGPTNQGVDNYRRTEKNVDDEVEAAFQNAIAELRACGAEVIEINFPNVFYSARSARRSDFNTLMNKYDLDGMIFPTFLSTPQKIGKDQNGKNWSKVSQPFLNNCYQISPATGFPEIAIPIGYHSNGASIGMEIATFKNHDQQLLNFAYSYALRYDHRVTPIGAPNDYAENYTEDLKTLVKNYQEAKDPVWDYEKTEGGAVITACGDAENAVITVPAELDGNTVIGIGANAFSGCAKAETVLIPKTVASVDTNAFSGCTSLKTIGFAGEQSAWDAMSVATSASVSCGYTIAGDYNGDLVTDSADAAFHLRSQMFTDSFRLPDSGDFNGDGTASFADTLQIYWHSLAPQDIALELKQAGGEQ